MAFFRSYFKSNSKIISLYFIGTFLLLLLITIAQQGWYLFNETDIYEEHFNEDDQFENSLDNISIPPNQLDSFQYTISKGNNLSTAFALYGMDQKKIQIFSKLVSSVFDLKKIKIGTHIKIIFYSINPSDPKEIVISLDNNKKIIILSNDKNSYDVIMKDEILTKKTEKLSTIISGSFISSIKKLKISQQSIQEIINAFSHDIDFKKDIKNGNQIEILVDKFYNSEGVFDHSGPIIYCKLILKNKELEIFLFKDSEGNINYYNADAMSIKKNILSKPIKSSRITSGFGMRKHPVLGYSRMHNGIDFAAPTGTPILSAGNGVVTVIGRKGGYGKYIKIKHDNTYSTAYAHLNKFAKDLKKGSKVKQGQIIGYVGMTGITSGPHLHFEVIKFDQHIDPKTIKAAPETKLTGNNLYNFKIMKKKILQQKSEL
jgi:murein DD-endopeptidase MepM/ murein hydrolase activator NlpD